MPNSFDTIQVEREEDGTTRLRVRWGFSTRSFVLSQELATKLYDDLGRLLGVYPVPEGAVVFVEGSEAETEELRQVLDLALTDPSFRVITDLPFRIVKIGQLRSREEMLEAWRELGESLGVVPTDADVSERVKAAFEEAWKWAFGEGELSSIDDLETVWKDSLARTSLVDLPDSDPVARRPSGQIGQ